MKFSLKTSLKAIVLLACSITMFCGFIISECTNNIYATKQKPFSMGHGNQKYSVIPCMLDLKNIIQALIEHHIQNKIEDEIPEEFFICYKTLLEGKNIFLTEDLLKALTYIALKLDELTQSKAPREDAPNGNPIVGPLIACDISSKIILVNQIINLIKNCCNQLEEDFNLTFSLVTDLNTTITTCITVITALDFSATATVLADIQNTLTACCQEIANEFQQTWTILAAGFNETSTVLADIKNTMTSCCANTQLNFQGTFTLITSIQNSKRCPPISLCSPIQIMAPTTISTPGFYCLNNDISGQIVINANDVTLDLNSHTITGGGIGSGSGIIVNSGFNRLIKNGNITAFDNGIQCIGNTDTVIENLIITNCFIEGVTINTGTAIFLDSLSIHNISGIGVHFVNGNDASSIKNSTVTQSEQGFVFDFIYNSLIQNCNVLDCSSNLNITAGNVGGFIINNGSFIQINNSSVKNYVGLQRIAGFALVNAVENVIFSNCTAQNIVATLPGQVVSIAFGYIAGLFTSHLEFTDCSALSVTADQIAVCFEIEGPGVTLDKCSAQICTSNSILADGFHSISNNVSISYCQAYKCKQNGFNLDSFNNSTVLQYCQSAYNNNGFIIQTPSSLLDNCVAFKNNIGFNLNIAGISLVHCFAAQNTTNYTFFANNVQNANTQVNNAAPLLTGPFAGANLFM